MPWDMTSNGMGTRKDKGVSEHARTRLPAVRFAP